VDVVLYQGTPGVRGVPVWTGTIGIQPCPYSANYQAVCYDAYPYAYQYKVDTRRLVGTQQFTLVLDPDGVTKDVNVANNVVVQTVDVRNPGLPELWVDGGSIRTDPSVVARSGGTAVVHATVGNTGFAAASDVRVDLVMAARTATIVLGSLAPGESTDVQFDVASSDFTTSKTVNVAVDPLNAIAESSKADNSASKQITVRDYDFSMTASTDPNPLPADRTVDFVITLRNTGTTAFTPVSTSFYCNTTGTSGTQRDGVALPPGAVRSYRLPISWTAWVGDLKFTYTAVLADASGVQEVQQGSLWTRAVNADFAVSGAGVALEPAGGEAVVPVVTVNNLGTLTASTSVRIYRGYPEQGDQASTGTVSVPGGGSAAWRGPAFDLPRSAPFVVTAVLDEEKAITELDETNNAATTTVKPRSSLVVVFDEDTPEKLIARVKPTVLVKGSDYKPEQVVGREIVEALGGQIVLIDLVPGHSTSSMVERSRNGR